MRRRQKRMLAVTLMLAGVGLAVALALQAFQENLLFFYSPTQVLAGDPPEGRKFRLGGLVAAGSVRREPGELEVLFDVTDNSSTLTVHYNGVLPDLFREGQGTMKTTCRRKSPRCLPSRGIRSTRRGPTSTCCRNTDSSAWPLLSASR